ncbi:MAG: MFS transporter [Hyphomicrobiales bacterium]
MDREPSPANEHGFDRAALRVVLLSSLGGALEFYDFIVFGTFAAYISKAFFPTSDPLVSLLLTFTLFVVGYLARPIGGLVFGARGDRSGRRGSFLLSLATMSAATIAMGLVPSYATGGIMATFAFVALRIVQGFCLGGELPGAITYAVEVVPLKRSTLACGVVFGCVSSGVLLATGISALLHTVLTAEAMESYGWRIGFFVGGALGVVSWMLRRTLEESPAFLEMRKLSSPAERAPVAELFAGYRQRILLGILSLGVVGAFNGLLFGHMPAYLTRTLGYPPPEVATALNVAAGVTAVSLVVATWIGDMIPRRLVLRFGCAVIALGALPTYAALVGHTMPLVPLFFLIGLSACFTHGTFAAILADLFPTAVRFSGVAFALNVGAVVFSGLGLLLSTWLIGATGRLDAPGFFLAASAALAFLSSFWLKGYEGEIGKRPSPPSARSEVGRLASAPAEG